MKKLEENKIIVFNGFSYNITNLGALLFSEDLERFDSIGRKAVRVIHYSGISRMTAIHEQVGKKGYAIGFSGLIRYIMDRLPHT